MTPIKAILFSTIELFGAKRMHLHFMGISFGGINKNWVERANLLKMLKCATIVWIHITSVRKCSASFAKWNFNKTARVTNNWIYLVFNSIIRHGLLNKTLVVTAFQRYYKYENVFLQKLSLLFVNSSLEKKLHLQKSHINKFRSILGSKRGKCFSKSNRCIKHK